MPSFAKSLSLHRDIQPFAEYAVTPFVGVWIETIQYSVLKFTHKVTPFVGVWIETADATQEGGELVAVGHFDGKKVEMAMWDEIKNDLKEEK